MKLVGSRKRLIVAGAVFAGVAVLGYGARKILVGDVDVASARRYEKMTEQQTLAPSLYFEAVKAKGTGDPKGALKHLKKLQKKCPDSIEAAQGLAMMAEMVTKGEAPADLLPDVYEWAMAAKDPKTAAERAKLLPHLRQMDAAKGWQLHWQLVTDAAGAGQNAQGAFMTLVDAVQKTEGDGAVPNLLSKALATPALQPISGRIVDMLIQRTELGQGAEAALSLAKKIAKEQAATQGGASAFRYACDTTERLKGDAEVLAFLKECAQVPGDGPVQQAAKARLAAHHVKQNDVESAVALYCGNAKPDAVLMLSPQILEGAVDNVVKAAGRNDVTAIGLLQALADKAVERKLYRVCADLYERAGVRRHRPEVKANEAETPFAEADVATFWQGYILWHGGDRDQGRKLYEQLLPRYNQGWQAGQMLYDAARCCLAGLQYDDAVAWAERGVKVLPKNSAMLALQKEAVAAQEKDKALASQILALRKEADSKTAPPAKAECCMKIAQAATDRKHYDEAVKEYRGVWENYPETPHAPKAMYTAAEILMEQSKDRRAAKEILEGMVFKYPANELSAKAFTLLKKMEGK